MLYFTMQLSQLGSDTMMKTEKNNKRVSFINKAAGTQSNAGKN